MHNYFTTQLPMGWVTIIIVSNLTDISNHPDTISNYFFISNYYNSQWSLNFCYSNYLSGHRCPNVDCSHYCSSKVCNGQLLLWWYQRKGVVLFPTMSRELQVATVSFSQSLQLLNRTSIWPNAHAWKRVLIHWTLRTPTIFMCSNYSRHWPK